MKQILWGWEDCFSNLVYWFRLLKDPNLKELSVAYSSYYWLWKHALSIDSTYDSPWVLYSIFTKYYPQGTITQFIKWKANNYSWLNQPSITQL